MPSETVRPETARTPLHALHLRLGAQMVPFAGYELPLHYPQGLLAEHLHTRYSAGLFDVSHMGQVVLTPRSGRFEDAARALEALMPVDVLGLAPGRQRYAFLTHDDGGIRDDLMIAHLGDRLALVVNAANKETDEAHLREHLSDSCDVVVLRRALIAIQGPASEAALLRLVPTLAGMRFMDVREVVLMGTPATVTRSGYTGEDGFEISLPEDAAEAVADALLGDVTVRPVGLGARDSLRLEAGLCLHGADIDGTTSPVEAGLTWAVQPVRCAGGERSGGFPGAERILREIAEGPTRRRVGLRPEGRAPVRAGAALFLGEAEAEAAGQVTSGGFAPSLRAPIAMGYLPLEAAEPGRRVFADLRGERLPLAVTPLPFVPAGFKR